MSNDTVFHDLGGGIGLSLPRVVSIPWYRGITIEIEPAYMPGQRMVVAKEVRVIGSAEEHITSSLLHSLKLKELLRKIATEAVTVDAGDDPRDPFGVYLSPDFSLPIPADVAEKMRLAGPIPATIKAVGLIYRVAELVGDAPVRAVQESFGLPRGTAASWVVRARAAGHLGDTDG